MSPLVSINIATYNSEKTLGKCLDSVRNQTYKNIEIIFMDSYSKDRALDIAKRYGAKIVFAPTTGQFNQLWSVLGTAVGLSGNIFRFNTWLKNWNANIN